MCPKWNLYVEYKEKDPIKIDIIQTENQTSWNGLRIVIPFCFYIAKLSYGSNQ